MEKETKQCPYCGKEILIVAKKCKYCGEWLEETQTQVEEQPKTKNCPYCGEEILAVAKKCKHCGELLVNINRNIETTEINQNNYKITYGPCTIIGSILSVIFVFFYWDSLNLSVWKCSLIGLILGTITTIIDNTVFKKK